MISMAAASLPRGDLARAIIDGRAADSPRRPIDSVRQRVEESALRPALSSLVARRDRRNGRGIACLRHCQKAARQENRRCRARALGSVVNDLKSAAEAPAIITPMTSRALAGY